MRYVINNNVFCKASDAKEYILNYVGEKYFKRMIDEEYGEIKIFNAYYKASDIIYTMQKWAYKIYKKSFYEEKGKIIENTVADMNEFEDIYLYGLRIISIPDN